MLTTVGIAFRAASLYDANARVGATAASRVVTTSTLARVVEPRRSGRSVDTTNRMARQIVVVWAKMSQSLRMECFCLQPSGKTRTCNRLECALDCEGPDSHATHRTRELPEPVSRCHPFPRLLPKWAAGGRARRSAG